MWLGSVAPWGSCKRGNSSDCHVAVKSFILGPRTSFLLQQAEPLTVFCASEVVLLRAEHLSVAKLTPRVVEAAKKWEIIGCEASLKVLKHLLEEKSSWLNQRLETLRELPSQLDAKALASGYMPWHWVGGRRRSSVASCTVPVCPWSPTRPSFDASIKRSSQARAMMRQTMP